MQGSINPPKLIKIVCYFCGALSEAQESLPKALCPGCMATLDVEEARKRRVQSTKAARKQLKVVK